MSRPSGPRLGAALRPSVILALFVGGVVLTRCWDDVGRRTPREARYDAVGVDDLAAPDALERHAGRPLPFLSAGEHAWTAAVARQWGQRGALRVVVPPPLEASHLYPHAASWPRAAVHEPELTAFAYIDQSSQYAKLLVGYYAWQPSPEGGLVPEFLREIPVADAPRNANVVESELWSLPGGPTFALFLHRRGVMLLAPPKPGELHLWQPRLERELAIEGSAPSMTSPAIELHVLTAETFRRRLHYAIGSPVATAERGERAWTRWVIDIPFGPAPCLHVPGTRLVECEDGVVCVAWLSVSRGLGIDAERSF